MERATYCTNELHVKALVSGILLIKDLTLSDGLSLIDQTILEKTFNDLFGNVGVTATLRSQDSADGLLVSFTLAIPVSHYGYSNTLFNGPHLAYLKAHDELMDFFRSDLFSSMLDSQIHSHLNRETSHLLESQIGQCHLNSHGSISLLSITENGWDNEVPFDAVISPVTFYPEDDDASQRAPFFSFRTGIPTFLIVVLVGGVVLFFFISSKKRLPLPLSSSSRKGQTTYSVIRTPSDEEAAAPDGNQRKKKLNVSSNTLSVSLCLLTHSVCSQSSSSSQSSSGLSGQSRERFSRSQPKKNPSKIQRQRFPHTLNRYEDSSDHSEEEEFDEDALSLILDAAAASASATSTTRQHKTKTVANSSKQEKRATTMTPKRFSRSKAQRKATEDDEDEEEFDLESFVEVFKGQH
jgi:hypothetical protein